MEVSPALEDPAILRAERDLYLQLLSLGEQNELGPFLEDALQLVVDVTRARSGYLELRDANDETAWHAVRGYSGQQIERVQTAVSRGIIGQAIATGETVLTQSALLDARFQSRDSVRSQQITSVLCAPIGEDPTIGVVYLEAPGVAHFDEADRTRAELFGRHSAPYADRLLLRRERGALPEALERLRRAHRFDRIVGRSPALARALEQAATSARLDVTILLTGESGTGKSQLARCIHEESTRAARPFIELNCAALPESLIESELFGAERGAHSTAREAVAGKIGAAEGGTLFLDEISELPGPAQAKLLQFVHSQTYYPLGAQKPRQANVRILAASNADLARRVAEGRFREDLYYRLKVLPLHMPSLSERREDVRDLAEHLCREACEQNRLPPLTLSRRALAEIEEAEWPGNVRELGNTVQAGAIRAAAAGLQQIEPDQLFPDATPASDDRAGSTPRGKSYQAATREFQATLVQRTLEETGWNVAETARRLDLARQYVHKLVRRFGLHRDA